MGIFLPVSAEPSMDMTDCQYQRKERTKLLPFFLKYFRRDLPGGSVDFGVARPFQPLGAAKSYAQIRLQSLAE